MSTSARQWAWFRDRTDAIIGGTGGHTSYYGYDAHGNVAFLTDATGNVTDTYDYDAWGKVVTQTGTTANSRLYAGEEYDPDLGVMNLRARFYVPETGRFLTIDPLDGFTSALPKPEADAGGRALMGVPMPSPFVSAFVCRAPVDAHVSAVEIS